MIRNDFIAQVSVQNEFPVVTSSSVGTQAAINNAKQFGVNYLAISLLTIVGAAIMYFIISAMVGL